MRFELAMIAKDIGEISTWFHNINSNKPYSIERKDIELLEDKSIRVREFIVSLSQYMNEIEE